MPRCPLPHATRPPSKRTQQVLLAGQPYAGSGAGSWQHHPLAEGDFRGELSRFASRPRSSSKEAVRSSTCFPIASAKTFNVVTDQLVRGGSSQILDNLIGCSLCTCMYLYYRHLQTILWTLTVTKAVAMVEKCNSSWGFHQPYTLRLHLMAQVCSQQGSSRVCGLWPFHGTRGVGGPWERVCFERKNLQELPNLRWYLKPHWRSLKLPPKRIQKVALIIQVQNHLVCWVFECWFVLQRESPARPHKWCARDPRPPPPMRIEFCGRHVQVSTGSLAAWPSLDHQIPLRQLIQCVVVVNDCTRRQARSSKCILTGGDLLCA